MKKSIMLLVGIACLLAFTAAAQQNVPYTFRYQPNAAHQDKLQLLTEVRHASATFLRLYLDDNTRLGPGSYLLLEGADGTRQQLDAEALTNWRNTTAYFNGRSVKVYLYTAPGDQPQVAIRSLRVGEGAAGVAKTNANSSARLPSLQTQPSASTTSSTAALPAGLDLQKAYPYAKAVGRFTNGGTGWIAPNGAIITSKYVYDLYAADQNTDMIIEFNVPDSDGAIVRHSAPEDQYLIRKGASFVKSGSEPLDFKGHDDLGYLFDADWAILEALPNGTGLRPGERQQQFFRVAINPGDFAVGAKSFPVDIFHYHGTSAMDILTNKYGTLHMTEATLLEQNKHISVLYEDRDRFMLYSSKPVMGNSVGAPVTYKGSNIAIGIHSVFLPDFPSFGIGFKDEKLRNNLKNFFSTKSVFVDAQGGANPGTGEVHRPYRKVESAVAAAQSGAPVFIAKGTYAETVTINKPLTLRAPVGKVVIGDYSASARTAADPSILQELFTDESVSFNAKEEEPAAAGTLVGYPNPFTDRMELKYALPAETDLTVEVFDILGNRMRTLLQTRQPAGNHTITWDGRDKGGKPADEGMYVIKLQAGTQARAIRVIKK